jgi:hypothetical protein
VQVSRPVQNQQCAAHEDQKTLRKKDEAARPYDPAVLACVTIVLVINKVP